MEKVDEEERQRKRKISGVEASGDGKNGDGAEVGWQRKMYKSQKGEEGLEFDVEEELDGWFGGSTTANAGYGPSVGDEIARLFGEVSGGAGFGLDGEVLDFWDGKDGQGTTVGGVSGAACQIGSQLFVNEEIRDVFGEEGGPNGENIEPLGGEHSYRVDSKNFSRNFGRDDGFQNEFFENGSHLRNLDGKEVGGLVSENACGNLAGNIGIHGGYVENRLGNGGREEVVKSKGKRGRPKGSKDKIKRLSASAGIQGLGGVGSDGVAENDIVRPKGKRGRPKGSKNKCKNLHPPKGLSKSKDLEGQKDHEMAGEVVGICEEGGVVRPKGSKNKMKNEVSDGNENVNEIVCLKGKRGRPKGAKNKKKKLAGEEDHGLLSINMDGIGNGSEIGPSPVLENEKTKPFGEEANERCGESTCKNGGGNESLLSKKKHGQPKGSKDKRENPATEEKREAPGEIIRGDHGGYQLMVLENERLALLDEGISGIPVEVYGGDEFRSQIIQSKRKAGRPKGSKNRKKEKQEIPGGSGGGNETVQRKKRRGRPKGSKNKGIIDAVKEDPSQGGENVGENYGGCNISKTNGCQPRGSKFRRRILLPRALNKILALKHQNLASVSKPEDQNEEDLKIIGFGVKQLRNTRKIEMNPNQLKSRSSNFQKRPRGRPRKLNKQHRDSRVIEEGQSTEMVSYLKSISSLS